MPHPKPSFHPEVFEAIQALELPEPDRAILTHGAALAVYGLRGEYEYTDIDLTASLENIQYLRRILGFTAVDNVVGKLKSGRDKVITSTTGRLRPDGPAYDVWRWDFSRAAYSQTGRGRIMLDEVPTVTHPDTGIRVARLEHIMAVKSLPRAGTHDAQDIAAMLEALREA
jgi:hypothetical protein